MYILLSTTRSTGIECRYWLWLRRHEICPPKTLKLVIISDPLGSGLALSISLMLLWCVFCITNKALNIELKRDRERRVLIESPSVSPLRSKVLYVLNNKFHSNNIISWTLPLNFGVSTNVNPQLLVFLHINPSIKYIDKKQQLSSSPFDNRWNVNIPLNLFVCRSSTLRFSHSHSRPYDNDSVRSHRSEKRRPSYGQIQSHSARNCV